MQEADADNQVDHNLQPSAACRLMTDDQFSVMASCSLLLQTIQQLTRLHILLLSCCKAVHTSAIQLQYRNFLLVTAVVLQLCRPLQYNTAIQVFYNLQKTCRLLAAVVKKLVLQLYCDCADCCNTTKFLCYVIVVEMHLCRPQLSVLSCGSCGNPVAPLTVTIGLYVLN